MKIDLYTKGVLTVIAVCLVYLCLGRPALMQTAHAQPSDATRVILAGWADPGGFVHRFDPSNRANGLPVQMK